MKNNKRIRSKNTKKSNSTRGESVQSMLAAKVTSGPDFPPEVDTSVQKTIRFIYTPTSAAVAFTPADILTQIPGNKPSGPNDPPVYFKNMRLIKVSGYDTGSGSGSLAPRVTISYPTDPRTFSRLGVQGAKSATLHTRPPLQVYEMWYPASDTTTKLATIAFGSTQAAETQIQLTVEAVGPTQT